MIQTMCPTLLKITTLTLLTSDCAKRKPIGCVGLNHVAEFGLWTVLSHAISNWCVLSIGQVYSLGFGLLVGSIIQYMENDRCSAVSHDVHHLSNERPT